MLTTADVLWLALLGLMCIAAWLLVFLAWELHKHLQQGIRSLTTLAAVARQILLTLEPERRAALERWRGPAGPADG